MKTYLFSYPFQGGRFSLELPAASEVEAKAKAEALRLGLEYDGELAISIPVPCGNWWLTESGSSRASDKQRGRNELQH